MEHVASSNEYPQLKSDILSRHADTLRELAAESSSVTEHVRRATALYQLSMQAYQDGGGLYAMSRQGSEPIPLFDVSEDSASQDRANLTVNLNAETAKALYELGVTTHDSDTTILDNVINHYTLAVRKSKEGYAIIIEYGNGTKGELFFL